MALLKVGSKASVFVTHLEFLGSECQIFCQVGDIGGQADTLAERVAEVIENGLASPVSGCAVGSICLALFHEDGSWYRARVLESRGSNLKVFFIDYGNTETVTVNNVREAPDYVLAIPALSTKCIVNDCTPISRVWTEDERKKVETMLHSGEFTCEVTSVDKSDINNEVYHVKLYNLDSPSTPIFVRPAAGKNQSIQLQMLKMEKENEVFVAFVESAKKFWVQLKSQDKELVSLMNDIAACFAEDLPSTGDIVNPVDGQVCAACFSDDGAFYRGLVQNVQGDSCVVFFVDYGNNEKKLTTELFTLPQTLCELPAQAILCTYKGDESVVEDKLHDLVNEERPSVLKVLSGNPNSGYVVEIDSVEKSLGRISGQSQGATVGSKAPAKLWQSYTSVIMQVDGLYDVCLSHIEHPGQFFVQLIGNAKTLDVLMQAIDEVAHNYDKLTNLYQGYPCLAKFSDGSWYRAEVTNVAVGKITVVAVDFGFTEVLPPSQLRNTDPNFKGQPAQAVKCSVDVNRSDQSSWSSAEIERFKSLVEKSALVAKVVTKKGCVHQLDLYETRGNTEKSIITELTRGSNQLAATNGSVRASSYQQQSRLQVSSVSLQLPDIPIGSKINLCFTAVKLPYLYGQLTSTPVEKVAQLQTDLNMYFEKNAGDLLTTTTVGSMCCTKYVDGGWYRGMVTKCAGNQAEVTFVDFGDSVNKSFNDLKVLPSSLCSLLPQQCLLCKIDNLPGSLQQNKIESVLLNNRVDVKLTKKEGTLISGVH